MKDLADEGKDRDLHILGIWIQPCGNRKERAEAHMHRLHPVGVEQFRHLTRIEQFAQHEIDEMLAVGIGEPEVAEGGQRLFQAGERLFGAHLRHGAAERYAERDAHIVDHIFGAGASEARLAAEVIGDRADIGGSEIGNVTGGNGVVAFLAEQPYGGFDQRRARDLGARNRFVHAPLPSPLFKSVD